MTEYVISLSASVSFAPATEAEEILQNVRTIIATRVGTVPLDRDFGTRWDAIDLPTRAAEMRARADIIEAVKAFEPRAKVKKVSFGGDTAQGKLNPVVTVSIGESNG